MVCFRVQDVAADIEPIMAKRMQTVSRPRLF